MDIPDRSAEMLKYVSGYYSYSKHYLAHNNAKGQEFDIIRSIVDDMPNQFNPQTATWGLRLWEEFLDLDGEGKSIEERRNQIILKSLTSYITPISLERLLKSITKTNVWVTNNIAPYTFSVEISTDNNVAINYDNIVKVVEDVKPAHLAYRTYFSSSTAMMVSIETTAVEKWPLLAGEIVTGIYPDISWPVRISQGKALVTGTGSGAKIEYDLAGTKPDTNVALVIREAVAKHSIEAAPVKVNFVQPGERQSGEIPDSNILLGTGEVLVNGELEASNLKFDCPMPGADTVGVLPDVKYAAAVQEAQVIGASEGGGVLVKHSLAGEDCENGKIEKGGIGAETSAESIRVIYPLCGEEL